MYFERGEVITQMRRKRATEFVTSEEMALREFYCAILRVGLDSEKRIFNEKMRKDAKRA